MEKDYSWIYFISICLEYVMTILGIFLVVFGFVDLFGSFVGIDVWGSWLGIELPEILWRFSALIEIVLGGFLVKVGSGDL